MWYNSKLSIYIPTHLLRNTELLALIATVTTLAGGCTVSDGRGAWVDSTGELIIEPMSVVTWWYRDDTNSTYVRALGVIPEWLMEQRRAIVKWLLNHGEEAVMIETMDRAAVFNKESKHVEA